MDPFVQIRVAHLRLLLCTNLPTKRILTSECIYSFWYNLTYLFNKCIMIDINSQSTIEYHRYIRWHDIVLDATVDHRQIDCCHIAQLQLGFHFGLFSRSECQHLVENVLRLSSGRILQYSRTMTRWSSTREFGTFGYTMSNFYLQNVIINQTLTTNSSFSVKHHKQLLITCNPFI